MTQNINGLFKKIKDLEPSAGLEKKILRKIVLERSWQAKKKLIFADVLMLGSLGAFVFVLINFWSGIAKSEFWSLLKLIVTDTGVITRHLGEFLLSLLETFPAAHLAAILAPVFLLLLSANFYFKLESSNRIKTWT